jgi:hypothetical protein
MKPSEAKIPDEHLDIRPQLLLEKAERDAREMAITMTITMDPEDCEDSDADDESIDESEVRAEEGLKAAPQKLTAENLATEKKTATAATSATEKRPLSLLNPFKLEGHPIGR